VSGIKCPHCKASLALDKIGVHFQKFCSAAKTESEREAAMKKFNLLYMEMQAHARGEITVAELQAEADRIFLKKS
jgi:glutaredoxin